MSGLSFQPGALVGGRYQLESKLGQGGMGEVWRAEHVTLKSPVAIKFINPQLASSGDALSRFMLEARSSAALRSTHIVQVFDFGVENEVPYIAMELLHGESLAGRLERERALSLEATVRIMTDVARAVDHAHEAGIVHRDLKPDNIFLVKEGPSEVAKVLDFGIAKVTQGGFGVTTGGGTKTGAVIGTPYYVSPEQALGDKQIDKRSDLWSLGVITFECLLGMPPFLSEGLGALILKICNDPAPMPSQAGLQLSGLDEWMQRALSKDPAGRFPAALPMFQALALLSGRGSQPASLPLSVAAASVGQEGRRLSAPPTSAAPGGTRTPDVGAPFGPPPDHSNHHRLGTAAGLASSSTYEPPRRSKGALVALGVVAMAAAGAGGWWLLRAPIDTESSLATSATPLVANQEPPSATEASPTQPEVKPAEAPLEPVPTASTNPEPDAAAVAEPTPAVAPSKAPTKRPSRPKPKGVPAAPVAAPPPPPPAPAPAPERTAKQRPKSSLYEDRK